MMCFGRSVALAAAVLLAACADTSSGTFDDGGGAGGSGGGAGGSGGDGGVSDGAALADALIQPRIAVVYAHSADALYKIDPDTLGVSQIARFSWPSSGFDEMTDIAVDKQGKMVGISFDKIYSVDTKTAACTYLAPLPDSFNGLSFITPEVAEGQEFLVATGQGGEVFEIDPATGKATFVGSFGSGIGSSGDLVSVKGFGTVATVINSGSTTDWLARIDPTSGKATLIGDTGFTDIWGLGFWKGQVYGFTEDSRFLLIDPQNGKAQEVSREGGPWWGAGVTTSAPVIK